MNMRGAAICLVAYLCLVYGIAAEVPQFVWLGGVGLFLGIAVLFIREGR
jgi:hypothetical protein